MNRFRKNAFLSLPTINFSAQDKVSFLIKRSKRDMSGKLNVKLKNRNGEDEVEFKVVVYDKPSPPIGPLEVSRVLKGYYEEKGFREEGRKDIESKGQIGEGRKGSKEGRVERVKAGRAEWRIRLYGGKGIGGMG